MCSGDASKLYDDIRDHCPHANISKVTIKNYYTMDHFSRMVYAKSDFTDVLALFYLVKIFSKKL